MIKARDYDIKKARATFDMLQRLAEDQGIDQDKAKEMAAGIIRVLQEHELTYSQAYEVLDFTRSTLEAMSGSLAL